MVRIMKKMEVENLVTHISVVELKPAKGGLFSVETYRNVSDRFVSTSKGYTKLQTELNLIVNFCCCALFKVLVAGTGNK